MRKKNGMKKSVLCLILTASMAMSGIPVAAEGFSDGESAWASENAQEGNSWEENEITNSSVETTETGEDSSSSAEDLGNEADEKPESDAAQQSSDQAAFSDGKTEVLDGFGSLDTDTGFLDSETAEEETGTDGEEEGTLTAEEIEAQLAPIRELAPISYVDPPEGDDSDTASVGGARATSYPAKYDPRGSLALPVRNQKPSNMCWSYTLAANLEISFLRAGAGLFDLSEEHLAYFFANRQNDPLGNTPNDRNKVLHSYRDGGNQTLAAIFLSSWSGMALESQVPYETNADHTLDSDAVPSSGMAYKTTAYLENAAFSSYSVAKIKNLISEYGSVSMSIGMYDSCYNPKTYAYSYSGNAGVNHAVTLVGWDDNFAKENFNSSCNVTSDGAWIVRNSWGEQWGDKGYFYISYENKCNYNIVAAEAVTNPKYRNNYFYDGSCALSKLKLYPSGSGGISSVSNVFQAKAGKGKGEALGEVVLSTYTDGGSYSIQVYTNLKDQSNPVSGTPAYSTPVTFYQEHAGISTVQVPEVNLISGTLYSVVVTNIGSGAVEYLCETNNSYSWVEFAADLKANQSFCYHEDNGWSDFSKTSPSACARIKAHTRTLDSAVAVGKPASFAAKAKAYNQIALTWEKVSGVSGYQVYRKEEGGSYRRVKTVSWKESSWTDTKVNPGITCTYRIRAYSVVSGTAKYSAYSSAVSVKTALSRPSVSVKVSSDLSNTVSWKKIAGASGYLVYRKTASGKWTRIATITKSSTITYQDKKISANTVYEYTVRAYRNVNGKRVTSSYRSSGKYKSAPARQTITSISNAKKGLLLKWKAQRKCDGYYIYRKVGNGSYKLAATIKKGRTASWTDTKVTKGRKYQYYICAYVKEPKGVVKSKYKVSFQVRRTR